jgi:hypothetical protein
MEVSNPGLPGDRVAVGEWCAQKKSLLGTGIILRDGADSKLTTVPPIVIGQMLRGLPGCHDALIIEKRRRQVSEASRSSDDGGRLSLWFST